jgi:hypothetical protein
MSKCRFEDEIGGYLLNRLEGTAKDAFEEHYFSCEDCFRRLQERDRLIRAVKARGPALLEARPERALVRRPAPFAWAAAAAGVLLVAATLLVAPRFGRKAQEIVLTGDGAVRGGTIACVAPQGDVPEAPAALEWRAAGADLEFRVYLFRSDVIWTGTTRSNAIELPDEVRRRLADGDAYEWQVKAFSPQGGLAALSDRVRFRVAPGR